MELTSPSQDVLRIISFLQKIYKKAQKTTGIVAVSGGIDSALSLTVLTKALGASNVYGLLLPYGQQSTADGQAICEWNKLSKDHILTHNIQTHVDTFCTQLEISKEDTIRKGNIMARSRMIILYDTAKKLDALVCGTENKSEHYLGYFTRFGDSASDIEPICHLYKTQVRQYARNLGIPEQFLTKAPSAGLWDHQTDETELGFSYEEADKVISEYLQEMPKHSEVSDVVREKVLKKIKSQQFKLEVPYVIS